MSRSATVSTATACLVCRAELTDGTALCTGDAEIIARDLGDVPELLGDLAVTRSRKHRTAPQSPRRGQRGEQLPWHEAASAAESRLRSLLIDEAGVPDAVTAAALLRAKVEPMRSDPRAGEFAAALRRAVSEARTAVDTPTIRTRFRVGPCPEWVSGSVDQPCWGIVRAHIGADDGDSVMTCPTCGSEWPKSTWLHVAPKIRARAAELDGAERTVGGLLVPFGVAVRINTDLTERFRPRAFGIPMMVPIFARHPEHAGRRVGYSFDLAETEQGLTGRFLIDDTDDGDEALRLVDSGALRHFSVAFTEVKNRRGWGGVTERVRARLEHVAMVETGAFGDAVRITRPRA